MNVDIGFGSGVLHIPSFSLSLCCSFLFLSEILFLSLSVEAVISSSFPKPSFSLSVEAVILLLLSDILFLSLLGGDCFDFSVLSALPSLRVLPPSLCFGCACEYRVPT